MSNSTTGLLVLLACAAVCAVIIHALVRRFLLASLLSAVVASSVFLALATWHDGRPDKFWPIGLFFGSLYAYGISFVIGLPFAMWRTDSRMGRCSKCHYDLTGNVSGICPECGTKIAPDETERTRSESV